MNAGSEFNAASVTTPYEALYHGQMDISSGWGSPATHTFVRSMFDASLSTSIYAQDGAVTPANLNMNYIVKI